MLHSVTYCILNIRLVLKKKIFRFHVEDSSSQGLCLLLNVGYVKSYENIVYTDNYTSCQDGWCYWLPDT